MRVVWLSYREDVPTKGYWDQGVVMQALELLGAVDCFSLDEVPEGEGAVVCLPAKAHEAHIERLKADLARLPWVLLVCAEDECGDFDTDALDHPNLRVWVQTPWPGRHRVDRPLPVGWRRECPDLMPPPRKDLDWSFCGQVTHSRRQECAAVLRELPGGEMVATSVFGARPDEGGLGYQEYLALMARTRVVPCPSGAVNPDSFRVWEALEAGCVPVADGTSPRHGFPETYWEQFDPPFPVLHDWALFPATLEAILADWQAHAVRCGAWWARYKRDLRVDLGGQPGCITALIPTSPIPDHPSVAHLVETLNSIRQYPELAQAEIIISCDGVRPEQADLRERYLEYVRELLYLANTQWQNVLVVVHHQHLHQVEMARQALALVRTEAILYVEHDTPLCDPIPWDGMLDALAEFDLIRFYHETSIPHEHGYLHRGEVVHGGHRFERTVQWSQRPHLARADWYRHILGRYFSAEARTFVEDKMHSVAQGSRWDGRLGIYLPEGESIRRSRHTDGRAGAPKFDESLRF